MEEGSMMNVKTHLSNSVLPVVFFASTALPALAHAQDLTITQVKGETKSTNTGQGTSFADTELKIDFSADESQGPIDLTTGGFELVCIDGKRQIRLTVPPTAFMMTEKGNFKVIDPNDPQGMGITMFFTDGTTEGEASPSYVDVKVRRTDASLLYKADLDVVVNLPVICRRAGLSSGQFTGILSEDVLGTEKMEFKFIPDLQ